MTSTTDAAGHPEVTELSDLTEGLLTPSRSADVRRHLDECPLCADIYGSLEEIRDVLSTLPEPPRMPEDIAARIDAAVAAEALPAATTASDEESEGRGEPVSRETSDPADRPSGRPRATTGPGRGPRRRRVRRGTVVLGSLFTVAAVGLGTLLVQDRGDDDNSVTAQHTPEAAVSFAGDTLEKQVAQLLPTEKTLKTSPDDQGDFSAATNPPGATPDAPNTLGAPDVPPCIAQGTGRSETPIAAKEGEYEGKDAYLVILPDPSDRGRVNAYIVDSTCIGADPAAPGKVLARQTFARP